MLSKPTGPFASDGEIASKMEEWGDALQARVAELEAGLQRLATWGETHGITSPEMEAVARETLKQ